MKVSVFHNVGEDHFFGYRPGDPLVRVFETEVPDDMEPGSAAELMFEIGNAPEDYLSGEKLRLALAYRARRLRSVSVGDVVAVGEVPLWCARTGWLLADGEVREVFTTGHGTVPLRTAVPS